jgi:hypothetical protein
MHFPKGGGTIKSESKPGGTVWSRVYIQDGILHVEMGRGSVEALSSEEMKSR